jgi:hypothetical protein
MSSRADSVPAKLAYMEYADEGRGRFLEDYRQYAPPDGFALSALLPTLREAVLSEPWDGLPVLASMVTEETGNRWLDYSNEYLAECGCYPQWEGHYEELLAEWQEAAPQLRKAQALIDQVKEHLPGSLDAVWEILLAAHEHYCNLPDADIAVVAPDAPLIKLFEE